MKKGNIDSSKTLSACSSSSTNSSFGSVGAMTTSRCCKLEEALECQVCLDVAVSPIYSCVEGGHILCYICHGKLAVPKKCPSCSSEGFDNPAALERQAQKLEYKMKCANAEAGCKEQILSTDFKVHLETCYFRDIECPLSGCNSKSFKFNQYGGHLRIVHEAEVYLADADAEEECFTITIPISVKIIGSSVYGIIFENKVFLLRTKLTPSIFHIWMKRIGDGKEAKKHVVKFSLFGKQKLPRDEAAFSWTVPVIPYHNDDLATKIEKTKPPFGRIGAKEFLSMAEKHGFNYLIKTKVELITMK